MRVRGGNNISRGSCAHTTLTPSLSLTLTLRYMEVDYGLTRVRVRVMVIIRVRVRGGVRSTVLGIHVGDVP